MTMPTLEDTIRDLAKRGEISHISLVPSQGGKTWRATFAMCRHFGVSFAEDADPVKAVLLALTTAKLKKPRAVIDLVADKVETKSATPDEHLGGITDREAASIRDSVEDLM